MQGFDFTAATTLRDALFRVPAGATYLAGGTTLVDLMKLDVLRPTSVVDINAVPLRGIDSGKQGLRIGALERMSDVAAHTRVSVDYPVIAQALLQSASPQIRNMASIGGNLMQRTRCDYFRDVNSACNKRRPGSGCPAQTGDNRGHAILGTSTACVSTHPSDLAVALVALDASVRLQSRDGERVVKLADFYLLPDLTPHVENRLRSGELITEVLVPPLWWARRSAYLKIRDRQSYEFALTSAAVALDLRGRMIQDVRVAVGGVGTRPWRLPQVEAALRGTPATRESFEEAAKLAAEGARPLARNAFKVALVQRTVARALITLAGAR